MTRLKLIIGALALATLLPGVSIIASSDAHAHCWGLPYRHCPIYHPQYRSAGATAIRMMYAGRFRIR